MQITFLFALLFAQSPVMNTDDFFADLKSADLGIRDKAATALIKAGRTDVTVVRRLVSNLHGGSLSHRVASASVLGRLGTHSRIAIPVLGMVFQDPNETTPLRIACGSALALIGHEAVDVFRNGLESKEIFVRRASADGLARVGKSDPSIIPYLIATLADRDQDVREIALTGLVEMDEVAMPLLRKSVGDNNPYISVLSIEALLKRGEERKLLVISQLGRLDHELDDIRYYAIRSLGNVKNGNNVRVVLRRVTESLSDPVSRNRTMAIGTLIALGKEAGQTLGRIEKCLSDEDGEVRIHAVRAIAYLGKRDARIVAILVSRLEDEDSDVVATVIEVLGDFGPRARTAVPALKRLSRNQLFAGGATEALRRINEQ